MSIEINKVADLSNRVITEVERAVVGKKEALQMIMAAFLSTGGHAIWPGTSKCEIGG